MFKPKSVAVKIEPNIAEVLSKKDRWVILSTAGPEGFPHSVPLGYFLAGAGIVMGVRDGTQKVKNIERDPKVSVLWENGRGHEALIGVLIQGHARIVRSDAERLELKAEACRQRGEPSPSEVSAGAVYIEVTPEKVIHWDRPSASRAGKKSSSETK